MLKHIEESQLAPELYPYGSRGPVGAHYLAAKCAILSFTGEASNKNSMKRVVEAPIFTTGSVSLRLARTKTQPHLTHPPTLDAQRLFIRSMCSLLLTETAIVSHFTWKAPTSRDHVIVLRRSCRYGVRWGDITNTDDDDG